MGKMKMSLSVRIKKLLDVGLEPEDIVKLTGYPADVVEMTVNQEGGRA